MKVSWVFAAGYVLDPAYDIEQLKRIGSSWGSWKSWRGCATDNVICHDLKKARELVQREFQKSCNFYVPAKHYSEIGRPTGLQLYEGDFQDAVDDIEDIIAMHFAAAESDIVLLAGFDFTVSTVPADEISRLRLRNRHGLMRSAISSKPATQWVAVDTQDDLIPAYEKLENLTRDRMESVLQLLV